MNHSGNIDYTEFLTFVASSDRLGDEESLKRAFSWIDYDNDNKISSSELQKCLNCEIPAEAIEEIMREYDTNCDGFITYDEFIKCIKG